MFYLNLKNLSKSFILTVLFSIMILSITNVAKADCPPGYQSETINFIYRTKSPYPNGYPVTCPIQLTYCYYCGLTGFGFDIQILEFTKMCDYPINEDFWVQARTVMLNDLLNKSTCIAPCSWEGWTTRTANIKHVNCWKKTHYDGTPVNHITYSICGSASCITAYKICVEYDEFGVATLHEEFDHQYAWPGESCQLYGEPISPINPGFWESGCFMFTSDCPNY